MIFTFIFILKIHDVSQVPNPKNNVDSEKMSQILKETQEQTCGPGVRVSGKEKVG